MLTSRDKVLIKVVSRHGFYLLIFVLAILSYIYGSVFQSSQRASNLKVLVVDYDGDLVSESLRQAYTSLKGRAFLSLEYGPVSDFDSVASIEQAVCSRRFWAGIFIHAHTTERLLRTLAGNTTLPYNLTDAVTFVYNGARYPVVAQSFIAADLQRLAAASSQVLYEVHGKALLSGVNQDSQLAVSALFQPLPSSTIVLHSMVQGTRILLNTITMVVAPLIQFFFVMAQDHVSSALSIFRETKARTLYLRRLLSSKVFALLAGLPVAAVTYGFRENWELTGTQFVEIWLVWAFYMDISYLVMDSVIGTLIQLKYAPFFIFSWIILNVTSTLFPFELNPGFYKWGYALPAHNVWSLLMQIYSRGCASQLEVALPVLFVWWLMGTFSSAAAVWRKTTTAKASSQKSSVANGK
ncbi:hypothetical protein NQ176_g5116 [Zarea fungicola]|uniref:Uncharacterized protein n=1 Tax=Zarea fungicola TaxID=93591 RepID=A0ACC1NA27_9HYPO|nr:hypothetical protein NQ176_g5116 [Lecanicillium fungicola]